MRILQVVFLLSVCVCSQALRLPISDILEIEKLSKDVTDRLFKVFKSVEIVGLSPKALKDVRQSMFIEFKDFNNKIEMFNAQLEGIGSEVLSVASVAYTDVQLQLKLKLLEANKYIDFVSLKYKDMVTLISSRKPYDDLTLEQFANSIVSRSSTSLQSLLDRIHATIAPEEDDDPSVLKILIEIMKVQGNEMFCNMETSWQQFHLNLYNTLALTELKGLLMMEFSYILLKFHNKGNFAEEIVTAQERYKDRSTTTLKLTIDALQSVPTEFWKCDPHKQVKNETYIEITELLQGFIETEMDERLYKKCYLTCALKNVSNGNICYDTRDKLCKKNRPCNGTLIDCHSIFSGRATVCLADAGTNRRYEYMEEEHKTFGRSKHCTQPTITFSDWAHGILVVCEYCMCYCDEQGVNSDRYFSMRPSESDIHLNKVVTGLRFVKKNRIIHLQIQQGKLLPRAKIDVTVDWKPVEDYRINDPGVHDGQDYHTLTWDKRDFDLDDLVAKDHQLLTGVGFRRIGSHLLLQVRLTPFNFTTGTLEMGKSNWTYNARSQDKKEINLDNKDIPILAQKGSHLFSKPKMVLKFTHSDLHMDLAQTTVPFIDAQAVTLAQPVALSGAGLMHKGSTKYGGFITPKIMTYKYYNVLYNAYDDNNYIYL